MITNDQTGSQGLTDRLLIALIIRITSVVFLALSLCSVFTNVTVAYFGGYFYSCFARILEILIILTLLFRGDKIAAGLTKQPELLDAPIKAVATIARSIGIILIATHIEPLCTGIAFILDPRITDLTRQGLLPFSDTRNSNLVLSVASILLGVYLASGARGFMGLIEKREKKCEPSDVNISEL